MLAAKSSLRVPFDPITVSYVMALRGIRGRLPNEPFTYAELGCGAGDRLILLAASNPEGTFFGFDPDLAKLNIAAERAENYGVKNLTFAQASASMLKQAVEDGVIAAKSFDYLAYDEIDNPAKESLTSLQACVRALLRDGGAFAYHYRTYDDENGHELLFQSLARHLLAESPDKADQLAADIRAMGQLYFATQPLQADAFDQAIKAGKGGEWLKGKIPADTRSSKTVQVSQAFTGNGLSFVGSGLIGNNYMELSVPGGAHAGLVARRSHPLYEALKDFAMHAGERLDIWGAEPLARTENLVTLFGAFTFGTTEVPERVARTVTFQGKSFSFVSPLYSGILSLATVMPVTMGDLVNHETLAGVDALTVLNAVQMMVACGVLQPMRASYVGGVEMNHPRLSGSYNAALRDTAVDFQDYLFASSVVGRPVQFSGMNAMILKALDKGGLNDVGNLLAQDLMRMADHPYLRPLGLEDPQRAVDEAVRQIDTVFNQSMVRWFALGIVANDE